MVERLTCRELLSPIAYGARTCHFHKQRHPALKSSRKHDYSPASVISALCHITVILNTLTKSALQISISVCDELAIS
jgi:hypothetical protein